MAYTPANDTGKYQQNASPYYSNNSSLLDVPSRASVVNPANAELPRYAKRLHIFVPAATAVGTLTVVFLGDSDNAGVTLSYAPGTYVLEAFVRRVTAVSGTGVIVTAFTD